MSRGPRLSELAERVPSCEDCGETEPMVATLRDWLDGLQARLDGHPSQPERTDRIMASARLVTCDLGTKH